MSVSTSEDPIAGLRNLTLDKKEDDIPQQDKMLGDLPPKVMTKILEWLAGSETRNNVLLSYRLVNHQWKDILDDLIEKKLESGRLQSFPAMKIGGESELLHVRCSPTVFRTGGDPFPFNSVLLSGKAKLNFMAECATDSQMELPVFILEFGGNLTSLALHDQRFPVSTLVAMLDSLPRLKLLRLMNVLPENSVIKPDAVLPTLPPLPSLAVLEVKFGPLNRRASGVDKERNVLYIWLIASYADQLVRLNLAADDPFPSFPPLRIQHQYSVSLSKNKMFRIGTTSESAFANSKELNIAWPTEDFLRRSETPSLRQLSVNGFVGLNRVNLWDLLHFVVKCKSTLEQLSLNVEWEQLVNNQLGVQQVTEGVLLPKLKTLAIHYPSLDFQEGFLSEVLLLMFPALEVLQLLNFMPHDLDCSKKKYPARELDEDGNDVKREDDAGDLKEQCALLRQKICDIQRKAGEFWARVQAQNVLMDQQQMANEAEEFQRAMLTARAERDSIFQRLEALGVKRETVIVEQLLERREIWRACANLKIVTVSSGRKPNGNICRVRKPNDA